MFVSLLIVGLLAVWLAPAALAHTAGKARDKTLSSTGHGLVALMTGFGGAGLLLVVIFVVGIALLAVTLAALAWTFWGVSFSALGFGFFSFLAYVMYGSQVVISYLLGQVILDRWAPRAAATKLWPLLLGIVVYSILRSIPILGWVIGLYGAILGLWAPKAAATKLWPLLLGIVVYSILRSIPILGWVIGLYGAILGLGAGWLAFRAWRDGGWEPVQAEAEQAPPVEALA
jgi:hypothetical protein